jgi:phosphotransferase family enzyme
LSDTTLIQVGRWLRRVHDLTAGFTPPPGQCWFAGRTMRPGLIIGHQDAAPHNAVVDGDRLVGFIDWDTAGPSTREWDLAFTALPWVPLAAVPGGGRPGSKERFHLLLDAYDYRGDRRSFRAVTAERARSQAGVIRRLAGAGDPASTALLPIADLLERSAVSVEALPTHFWLG